MPTAAGLYYFAHGEDFLDRPPVLLLHGAGGSHLNWPPQLRRLTNQRVYTLDLPGHGKSEGVSKQDIGEYSTSVVEFMKALRISNAVIVGFSMGSAVALALALRYRKRPIALVLIGSGAKMRVDSTVLEMASNSSTFDATVETIIGNSYSSDVDLHIKELAGRQLAETRPTVLYGDLLACDAFDVMDQVKKIHVPTLLICGGADRMTPPNRSEYLHNQIKDARLHILEGAGHMVMIEQPDQVAHLLDSFIDEIRV